MYIQINECMYKILISYLQYTQSQLTFEDLLWDLDLEGTEASPGSAEEAALFSNMEYLRDLPSPSPSEEEWLLK